MDAEKKPVALILYLPDDIRRALCRARRSDNGVYEENVDYFDGVNLDLAGPVDLSVTLTYRYLGGDVYVLPNGMKIRVPAELLDCRDEEG